MFSQKYYFVSSKTQNILDVKISFEDNLELHWLGNLLYDLLKNC